MPDSREKNTQRTIIVSIQGWELEVLEGPQRVHVEPIGEMLEFKGIWVTEPERGIVTVYCYPEKIFYFEVTEEEKQVKHNDRKGKVTPLRRMVSYLHPVPDPQQEKPPSSLPPPEDKKILTGEEERNITSGATTDENRKQETEKEASNNISNNIDTSNNN